MIKEKFVELMKGFEPEVQRVIHQVIQAEWAKLNLKNPRWIKEDIRQIIEEEVKRNEA